VRTPVRRIPLHATLMEADRGDLRLAGASNHNGRSGVPYFHNITFKQSHTRERWWHCQSLHLHIKGFMLFASYRNGRQVIPADSSEFLFCWEV